MAEPTRRGIDLTWIALGIGVTSLAVALVVLYILAQPLRLEPIGALPSVPILR